MEGNLLLVEHAPAALSLLLRLWLLLLENGFIGVPGLVHHVQIMV